jgi:hypothetical protein
MILGRVTVRTGVAALLFLFLLLTGCGEAVLREWGSGTVIIRVGAPLPGSAGIALQLDERGDGVVELPLGDTGLDSASQLVLSLGAQADDLGLRAVWWTEVGVDLQAVPFVAAGDARYEAAVSSASSWPPKVDTIAIQLSGKPRTSVVISGLQLLSSNPLTPLLTSARTSWTAQPWTHASINSVFLDFSPPWGAPLVGWCALILFLALLLIWSIPVNPAARVRWSIGLILLLWLPLDGFWLRQLALRASDTQEQFAGKRSELARLSSSSDRAIFSLARQVSVWLPDDARVFVATNLDFEGGRVAYYLYPHNVYWLRGGPELPSAEALRAGDFVLSIAPSELLIAPDGAALRLPDGSVVDVLQQWSRGSAALFRVL